MNFAGCHFIYAGVSSRQYSLRFANFETSEKLQLNGSFSAATVFNSRNERKYIVANKYEDSALAFEVEILNDKERALSVGEQREIARWLFNKNDYNKLYIDMADDIGGETYEIIGGKVKQFYLNCRFINPVKVWGNGGIVGYRCSVECDSYMLWQDAISVTKSLSTGDNTFKLNINSDGEDYIYPKVTFKINESGGELRIINRTDDESRITSFKALTPEITFSMNSETNFITGENYLKFHDKNFIRL